TTRSVMFGLRRMRTVDSLSTVAVAIQSFLTKTVGVIQNHCRLPPGVPHLLLGPALVVA
ncbi:hypothetical protein BGZ95_004456, partial [Linnemannia exigua]